jgi:hypothetical protein
MEKPKGLPTNYSLFWYVRRVDFETEMTLDDAVVELRKLEPEAPLAPISNAGKSLTLKIESDDAVNFEIYPHGFFQRRLYYMQGRLERTEDGTMLVQAELRVDLRFTLLSIVVLLLVFAPFLIRMFPVMLVLMFGVCLILWINIRSWQVTFEALLSRLGGKKKIGVADAPRK